MHWVFNDAQDNGTTWGAPELLPPGIVGPARVNAGCDCCILGGNHAFICSLRHCVTVPFGCIQRLVPGMLHVYAQDLKTARSNVWMWHFVYNEIWVHRLGCVQKCWTPLLCISCGPVEQAVGAGWWHNALSNEWGKGFEWKGKLNQAKLTWYVDSSKDGFIFHQLSIRLLRMRGHDIWEWSDCWNSWKGVFGLCIKDHCAYSNFEEHHLQTAALVL